MASRLNPYLHFRGNAREAMEFYRDVLGGDLQLMTFAQFGSEDPTLAEQVMHGQLETPSGYTLMASDTPPDMSHNPGDNFTISLSGDDGDELRGYFERLSEGGSVYTPLQKQVWGDEFGALTDKFGVAWLVNISDPV
ncbi:VOC family protein [Cryptosporangium aurantiacum]|uniref:PhnB protein n=1 Tax=Cryptosporangium aurantiacum TaxID=134849 RepID=A0A1M7RQ18_9ACTN|nr:VOC family protein [Cryptosporangium aurantiacum]SHN48148.1 PhnB protein [Cryptosporangium aurantiacum]